MRPIRNLISLIVLLLGTAISVAAAVQVARQKLPAPANAERLDFTEWMTERDLSQESAATRRMLAQRMEVELRAGQWSGRVKDQELSPEQQQLVQENLLRVLEQYFLEKMHRYYQRPEAARDEYLDRELDKLTRLLERHIPQQLAPAEASFPQALVALAVVNLKIDEWIGRAEPAAQPQMREFQAAVINRLNRRLTDRALEQP